jgi:glycosyltransferase involved in cell wall biosynthesis
VLVVAPSDGPLRAELEDAGAEVRRLAFPVLRRADAHPAGMARLLVAAARSAPGMVTLLRRVRPDVVLVNTITLPLWPVVTRLTHTTTVCHVHEAERNDPRPVRVAMGVFVALAHVVVVNSRTTLESVCSVTPWVRKRTRLVHNGVQPPERPPGPPDWGPPHRLVVVGRVSRRKAPDVALEATALLRKAGHDVHLEIVGTPAPGQDDFLEDLRRRSERPDLAGAVTFSGYVNPVWPALERSSVALAPSLGESFGNAVVEAQLAGRPVVATAVQGHLETVTDGETGILVPPSDAEALARAIAGLLGDPATATRIAHAARQSALARFTSERYCAEMRDLMGALARRQAHRR